jgi:hypothetical protein
MIVKTIILILAGFIIGTGAAFAGVGGGFLIVPFLLFLGFTCQKAVGTSFMAILIISIAALITHNKLANVDYRTGLILGAGGLMGVPLGAKLLEHVSDANFRRIFAVVLLGMAFYLFFRK